MHVWVEQCSAKFGKTGLAADSTGVIMWTCRDVLQSDVEYRTRIVVPWLVAIAETGKDDRWGSITDDPSRKGDGGKTISKRLTAPPIACFSHFFQASN